MTRKKKELLDAKLAAVTAKVAELERMTVGTLQVEWQRVFKEPARSRNKRYLIKRIAWRVQELAFGGLSAAARRRIEELAPDAPIRRRLSPAQARAEREGAAVASAPAKARDPRLPVPGTLLRRAHGGTEHVVRVAERGFEYRGRTYRSLSAIAKAITGSEWNGFVFFGLGKEKAA